jgi:hypothetical protein
VPGKASEAVVPDAVWVTVVHVWWSGRRCCGRCRRASGVSVGGFLLVLSCIGTLVGGTVTAMRKWPAPTCMTCFQVLGHLALCRFRTSRSTNTATTDILCPNLPKNFLASRRGSGRRCCTSRWTSALGQEEKPRVTLAHSTKGRIVAVHDVEWDREKDPDQETVWQELVYRSLFKQPFGGNGTPEERSREEQVQVPERPSTIIIGARKKSTAVTLDMKPLNCML